MKPFIVVASVSVLLSGCVAQQPTHPGQIFAGGASAPLATLPQVASTTPIVDAVGNAAQLGLINILTGQLGITQQQALGGAGSIFQVAQQRMAPNDFSMLSNAIPGMNQYLAAAPQIASSNSSGILGAAAGMAGAQAGGLMGLASLVTSFNSLGLNAGMINQFVPLMLQYVQQQSGPTTMTLLQSALR